MRFSFPVRTQRKQFIVSLPEHNIIHISGAGSPGKIFQDYLNSSFEKYNSLTDGMITDKSGFVKYMDFPDDLIQAL